MEPIICNLGAVVPEDEFIRGVRKLCTRYGTLFIADEVATGFGRTGKLFACEHFDLEPDVLCMAKAITGGYGGLGAVITTSKIANAIKEDFGLYSTYGWHPRAVAVALANLRYLTRHRNKLLKNATATRPVLPHPALSDELQRQSHRPRQRLRHRHRSRKTKTTPPRSATPAAKTACSSPPKKTSSCSSPP